MSVRAYYVEEIKSTQNYDYYRIHKEPSFNLSQDTEIEKITNGETNEIRYIEQSVLKNFLKKKPKSEYTKLRQDLKLIEKTKDWSDLKYECY